MKKIGFVLTFMIWIGSLLCYLFLLLGVIYSAYPEISREPDLLPDSYIHFASILFMLVNFGMIFIGMKIGIFKTKRLKLSLFIIPIILYLGALLSPIYLVYFSNVENLKIRANQRAFEGNWNQAMDIYCFIKPRNNEQNQNITTIQNWLKEAGYYQYEVNGLADKLIVEQLKLFQKENDLAPDGFIGEETQFVLFNKIFKDNLDSLKSERNLDSIKSGITRFVKNNNIIEYDNTRAILYGIMFQESLGLMPDKLKIEYLRDAVKNFDGGYVSNGRFDDRIITELINADKNK